MYWDVVEVKPQADYRLFVRFKDGLSGHVRLRREELTGVLAPLLDVQFFAQAFVDDGVVAWPGEIDLAPDVMYAEVTFRSQLRRLYELKDLLTDPSHPDAYFQNLEDNLQDKDCFHAFARWENELQGLDSEAWEVLKSKASRYLQRKDKKGRGWQQLFDALVEALAYNYLKASVGCSAVRFVPESDARTPDIEGVCDGARVLCEVKTINLSDNEIEARQGPPMAREISGLLSNQLLSKLDKCVANAQSQLHNSDPKGNARRLVYLNIHPDDWVPDHWDVYVQQIRERIKNIAPGIQIVANIGPCTPWARIVVFPERT